MTSDLIRSDHLNRKAVIYIRQSTPNQVVTNQESLRLQYALQQRAQELGWRESDIEVIDCDLGQSGASVEHRRGFKDLITQVTMDQVGLVLSVDVTRLTRNCSDWYPLLDLCGYRDCLIADRDGVYDPGTPNGRLLLGLKGTISEMELHTIRHRLTAGLLNKAGRGELAQSLPSGLVRDLSGVVVKTPNREVQDRIDLLFQTFLEKGSVSKVQRLFLDQELTIPCRDYGGNIQWKRPSRSAITRFLKNPAYAGAFVYGRTRTERRRRADGHQAITRRPREEWRIVVKDVYPSYITWETFEKIEAILSDNYAEYQRRGSRGIARGGKSLLQGIVYCGRCGHKLMVEYRSGNYYTCRDANRTSHDAKCQVVLADPIDEAVSRAFLEAVAPAELEAWEHALRATRQADDALHQAAIQQVKRLRYQAALAERQYNGVDPDNRLVAGELERRWELALRELHDAEQSLAERRSGLGPGEHSMEALRLSFAHITHKLPEIWKDPRLSLSHRKSLLRCLIDKIVIDRQSTDCATIRIVWQGGENSNVQVVVRRRPLRNLPRIEEMKGRIAELVGTACSDTEIANILTNEGFHSPLRDDVTRSTVEKLRVNAGLYRRANRQAYQKGAAGSLTVSQIAHHLGVSGQWILYRIHAGRIAVRLDTSRRAYLFPDSPETLILFERFRDGELSKLDFLTSSSL